MESNGSRVPVHGRGIDREEGVRVRKRVLVVILTGLLSTVGVSAAFAGKPGPGDKQCVPGQNGNPKPGQKAGVCPNPGK